MKNIASIDSNDDKASYLKIVKKSRKPQKPFLLAEQVKVEVALAEYTRNLTSGSMMPLGFINEIHDFHYKLYDSKMDEVDDLKDTLINMYLGHSCPYCQLDTVSHIDHFLPRSKFPELSVSLQNLLMSCDICNSLYKREKWGNGTAQPVFHPMYNLLTNDQYLAAVVRYTQKALVVTFSIRPGLPMSSLLQRHFDTMGLDERYMAKVTSGEVPKITNLLEAETDLAQRTIRLAQWTANQIVANSVNTWEHAFYSAFHPLVPKVANGGL